MKRSQIYLVILGLWLCLGASSLAQAPPPNYRIEFFTHPNAESYSVRDANNLGVVVGYVKSTDVTGTKSLVVDQNGVITPPDGVPIKKQYVLEELVDLPPGLTSEYPYSFINAINESCQVVGRFSDGNGQMIGFFADLNEPGSFEVLPNPAFARRVHGREINEGGDVLILSQVGAEEQTYYIYNPTLPATEPVSLIDPRTNQPLEGNVNGFNNVRQVVGRLASNDLYFRLTPETLEDPAVLETFDASYSIMNINDKGQFCGEFDLSTDAGDNVLFRYTDPELLQFIGVEFSGGYSEINSDGDVAMVSRVTSSSPYRASVFHDDHGLLHLDDLVVGETAADLDFWNAASVSYSIDINDRDAATDFGQIFGTAYRTTGRGRKEVTETRIFILTPIASGPTVSVNDVTIDEGNAGTTTDGQFTVTLSELAGEDVTVPYEILDGTATTGDDYTTSDSSGLLTFASSAGETSKTVEFTIVGDDTNEPDETFTIVLGEAVGGATVTSGTGTATIKNDEVSNVTMSVDDPSVTEGDRKDKTPGEFTITLSAASASDVQVLYQVSNGSAGNKDYRMVDSASGLLTFAPGDTSKTVRFDILGDTRRESDETFTIELTNAFGATISKSVGTTTITDND